jgi:hypothetical protein
MDEEKSSKDQSIDEERSISLVSASPSTPNGNVEPTTNLSTLEKSQTARSGMDSNIPFWRRCLIVFVLSWVTLCATFSSTSLLSVASEIAKDLNTTTEAVNLSTGGSLLVMGLSSFIWSPIASVSFFLIG